MNKDIQYINLIRKLHRAERRIQEFVPIGLLDDITWDTYGKDNVQTEVPYKEGFEKSLHDIGCSELKIIEWRKLRQAREDVYWEIRDCIGNEKFLVFFKEYHELHRNPKFDVEKGLKQKDENGFVIPMLVPKHNIGRLSPFQDKDNPILNPNKDTMPVTFGVLNHCPIDKYSKVKTYAVEVNGVETTMSYNQYSFMDYVSREYQDKKFHPMNLLVYLEEEELITNSYSGRLQDLFKTRIDLLKILFTSVKSDKGYWICNVEHWFNMSYK